jgi:phosphinothricin acetyltransferase
MDSMPDPEPAPDAPAPVVIRPARKDDLTRLTDIYNHYVLHTPTTFDLEPFSVERRNEWFERYSTTGRYRLLVAEEGGHVVAYTSSSRFHTRAAYDTTVELTVLCAPESIGRGIGNSLYASLMPMLEAEDIRLIVALITLPNDASCRLHERFGLSRLGVLPQAGRKFDQYWDVALYGRTIGVG